MPTTTVKGPVLPSLVTQHLETPGESMPRRSWLRSRSNGKTSEMRKGETSDVFLITPNARLPAGPSQIAVTNAGTQPALLPAGFPLVVGQSFDGEVTHCGPPTASHNAELPLRSIFHIKDEIDARPYSEGDDPDFSHLPSPTDASSTLVDGKWRVGLSASTAEADSSLVALLGSYPDVFSQDGKSGHVPSSGMKIVLKDGALLHSVPSRRYSALQRAVADEQIKQMHKYQCRTIGRAFAYLVRKRGLAGKSPATINPDYRTWDPEEFVDSNIVRRDGTSRDDYVGPTENWRLTEA